MNIDHIQGTTRIAIGSVQEKFGRLTGSHRHRLSGIQRQVSGYTQRLVGNAREALKGATLRP